MPCAGEDMKHIKMFQPEKVPDAKPPSPVERLLSRYFEFVQMVSTDDPVMQLTFWRVRKTSAVHKPHNLFRRCCRRPRHAAYLLAGVVL